VGRPSCRNSDVNLESPSSSRSLWLLASQLRLVNMSSAHKDRFLTRIRHHMAKDDSIWKACFRKHFPGYPLPSPSAEGSSWFIETAKMAKGLAPITWDPESSAKSFDFDKANKLATRTKGTGPKYPKAISFMPIDLKKKHEFAFLLKGHAILGLYSTSSKVDLHQELNVAGEAKDPAELVKSERVLEASVIFTRTKKHHYFENYRWDARGSARDNYLLSPRSLMGLFDKNPGGVLCELRIQNEKVTWHLAGKEVAEFTFKPTQTYDPPPTIETYLVYCNSAPGSSLESIPPLYRK